MFSKSLREWLRIDQIKPTASKPVNDKKKKHKKYVVHCSRDIIVHKKKCDKQSCNWAQHFSLLKCVILDYSIGLQSDL